MWFTVVEMTTTGTENAEKGICRDAEVIFHGPPKHWKIWRS